MKRNRHVHVYNIDKRNRRMRRRGGDEQEIVGIRGRERGREYGIVVKEHNVQFNSSSTLFFFVF